MLKRKPVRILAEQLLLFLFLLAWQNASALPVASFTANQTNGCLPLNVQYTSTSTGAVSWFWDLGNGNTSTLSNPSNLYTTSGNFTITLIAFDASGNSDTARYTNFITVEGRPTADFNSNITTACPDNNLFIFTNSSFGSATSFLWDFGDGTTSSLENPTHSYTYAGMFTVTLIAMNGSGCQDDKIRNQYITVFPKPDASITVNDTSTCDPSTVFQFSNNSTNGTSWNWDFDDLSASSLQNPSHTFPRPGTFNVSVLVSNSFGCSDTTDNPLKIYVGLHNWATFEENVDSGCAELAVQFTNANANVATSFWSFGDGSTSFANSPSHTYTSGGNFSVSLIVTTTNNCVDTVVKSNHIKVGIKPITSFQYSNAIGCAPLPVQFTNSSTNFDSCVWYFGDGTSSTEINPTHVYTSGGTFSVTLQCWSSSGCGSNIIKNDIVTITKPNAIFNASPRIGCPPLMSSFISTALSGNLNYLWNFGDGGTSIQANPIHNYSTSGNFDVSLIVIDSIGCTDTIFKPNYIQTVNPAANYIPPPTTSGCAPLTAQFTDATAGSVSWFWNFGDGFTSTVQNPTHTYSSTGTFTVSLTTTSAGGGCSQTISNFSTFDVNGGYAGFTHTASPCPPYIATFQDTSLNAVSWFWDFGDGKTDTTQNPNHTYATPGYHSVSLNITTADGCSYTTMQSNIVYFSPFGANFYGVPLDTIFPLPVQFYANSVGATSWLWSFGDSTFSSNENPLHTYSTLMAYAVTLTISNGTCSIFYNPPPFIFGNPDTTMIDLGHGPTIDVQQGCTPLNVLFTNIIAGAAFWNWDFGDGSTSDLEFPTHIYTQTGIYNVTLTTIDTSGIVQVLQMDSIVRASGPQPGFILTQTVSCTNTFVSLIDTSRNATKWNWNLGDGTIDSTQNLIHLYSSGLPNYIITQTVSDTMGCSASISTSIFANSSSPLLASESEVCGYDTVRFFTSLQNFNSYQWSFGDGSTSNQMNPSHVYSSEGNYTVSLTISDNSGCIQTFFVNSTIKVKLPIANFSSSGLRQACNETDIQFINNSQNSNTFLWDLGDGNTSALMNPFHSYKQAGVYDVTLTVYSGACRNTYQMPQYVRVDTAHAEFVYTTNQTCVPVTITFQDLSINPVSWHWDFGLGDTSNLQNPSYTYSTYPCCYPFLTITDIHGCSDYYYMSSPPVAEAAIATSSDSGCFPFKVQFISGGGIFINQWYWDFGDGTTSNQQNPSHTYTEPGTYDIMLVVKSLWSVECNDTLIIPKKIKVRQPHADFYSTDLSACAPSLVNFHDLSVDADNYLWDFGDGTTSTNVNPSHIYNTPGNFNVKLVTSSSLGCSDSILYEHYIQVLGPIANFSTSATEGCSPFKIEFTDHSINAMSHSWNFGDGYSDFSTNATHTFNDSGSFNISLVTTDTSGCTSFYEYPQQILIHPSPQSSFTSDSITGCQPFTANFTNSSFNYQNILWNFGDGSTSTDFTPIHEYTSSGIFNVSLIAYNQFGCNDTSFLNQPLEVYKTPLPSFIVNDITGCAPLHVAFINNSTNLEGPQYLWDFGNGNTSTEANPYFDYTQQGSYTVGLTITNANGCTSTLNIPALFHIPDSLPPNETKILSVSVLSNTSVKIIWENNPAIDLAAYVIYRNDPMMNIFRPIYTITNIDNTNFSLTAEYTDNGLNTLQNTYTYKVQAIDTCGNTIPLERLASHTTINISSIRSGENIFVNWTPYGGCAVSSYLLYRSAPGEQFTFLATLPPDTLNYLDTTFTCPIPYSYKVIATDLCGNTYTSFSDTSITIPLNVLQGQVVDVIRSTVVENLSVLSEWKQPLIHPEKVAQFDIYRSTDNSNFYFLESVPSVQTDYMDYNVDVQSEHYYYKILVVNTCDIDEDLSGLTSTIILKGEMDEGRQVLLTWSPYEGWENGVEYYIIERMDENGNWQLLKQVDGNVLKYKHQE